MYIVFEGTHMSPAFSKLPEEKCPQGDNTASLHAIIIIALHICKSETINIPSLKLEHWLICEKR